jgi:prolyl-tRNA synthetase
MFIAYLRTFARMGLRHPDAGATGPIGGDLSHEFIVLAPTGESEVSTTPRSKDWRSPALAIDDADGLQRFCSARSARPMPRPTRSARRRWAGPEERRAQGRGIEVGHIFYFGDKYSAAMGLKVQGPTAAGHR